MNIKMTIEVSPEQAIEIAKILGSKGNLTATAPTPPVQHLPVASQTAAANIPAAVPTVQTAPVQQTVPVIPSAAQQIPPVSVRKYTMDELALASRPICEAGRQAELINLLHSFTYTDNAGNTQTVQSIQQLPEESYPAFANGIRALGGKI